MNKIIVGILGREPEDYDIFDDPFGGIYDKETQLFKIRDSLGNIYYYPRENVATYAEIKKNPFIDNAEKIKKLVLKEEKTDDLGKQET